jgi:hypothetical protein
MEYFDWDTIDLFHKPKRNNIVFGVHLKVAVRG